MIDPRAPYSYILMPLNANGDGPETDPAMVTHSVHEIWDANCNTVGWGMTAFDAMAMASSLNDRAGLLERLWNAYKHIQELELKPQLNPGTSIGTNKRDFALKLLHSVITDLEDHDTVLRASTASYTTAETFDQDLVTDKGWPAPGDRMRFLNRNGYDNERTNARNNGFVEGEIYTVVSCRVGNWDHSIFFEGVNGGWNGVMFEKVA